MMSLMENYPPENFFGAFNLIDGHDRIRALTSVGGAPENLSDVQRERYRLPEKLYQLAVRRLKLLSVLQYASPACHAFITEMRRAYRALRIPITVEPIPGDARMPDFCSTTVCWGLFIMSIRC